MGMFDYLVIDDIHLPDELKGLNDGWQTKSLNCELDIIIIDNNGDLYIEEKTYTKTKTESYLPIENKKLNYSGDIIFYDFIFSDYWIEFKATFLNGKLIRIDELNKEFFN